LIKSVVLAHIPHLLTIEEWRLQGTRAGAIYRQVYSDARGGNEKEVQCSGLEMDTLHAGQSRYWFKKNHKTKNIFYSGEEGE
jgi:hypothetical protein